MELTKELLDLIYDVLDIASTERCRNDVGKKYPCENCSYQDGYCDYDENGKAFFHREGTCSIDKLYKKLKEIEGD